MTCQQPLLTPKAAAYLQSPQNRR